MSIRGLITTGLLDSVAEVITLGLDPAVTAASTANAKRVVVTQPYLSVTVTQNMGVTISQPGARSVTIEEI